jgi:tetratricopeptide (TPR) repeat protein
MTTTKQSLRTETGATTQALVAVVVIICGLAGSSLLARWIDARRPAADFQPEEGRLYLTGAALKRASLGFNGLAADWYWMRALQYVGGKMVRAGSNVSGDQLGQLNLKLLAPLLDTATTLDPRFMEPYEYAAIVLPDVDLPEAIRITKKGIAANPTAWRLQQHLGFIYWQQKDYQAAGEAYEQGARLPGAPAWMEAMKARMAHEGGSRGLAREIYGRIYQQSKDAQVKEMARLRLLNLASLDEREALAKGLLLFQAKAGRCAATWREVQPLTRGLNLKLDGAGAPLDPGGTPYVLNVEKCEVNLARNSTVPFK